MDLQKADISDTTLQNESMNTKMLKGAQNQIKIVRVTSKLSHWDLRLTYDKQYINLQEYEEEEEFDLDTDLRLQCNEQDNNLQEYSDLEADFRLKYNDQDNHLQEYPYIGAYMQEYAEEGKDFKEYSEDYNKTNVVESIQPELDTAQQHIKVKGEIIEELDSSDNLSQVKEEVFSDIVIDESENDLKDFSDVIIRVKEELNESQPSESTYSTFDEINKHSIKEVEAIPKHLNKVDKVLKHNRKAKNSLKTDKKLIDEVSKSSKLDGISGPEYSTFQCNVCFKAFLGDNAYNEHMKKHTAKDISSAEVIPSNRVVKIGNPLSDNWVMVKVKKFRVKRLANDKANENRTTKKYTISSAIEVENDWSTDKVYDNDSKKSVIINGDSSVTIDNDPLKVDNDSKVEVDEDYDNSTVKENKDLLIEIPGKTKVVKLPEGKKELPEERTKRLYKNHINVTYKVCNESCTNKKFCTQSKEGLCKQRTKQDINTGFACTKCDYKGNQKHHLDRHVMLIHNRVKNFRCNLCDYKGVQQCHLDQHMRRHTGVKLFSSTRAKKYASRKSANNIVFSNVTQNKNYFNSVRDDNNVEVDNDGSTVKVDNNENSVTIDNVEVDNDNKFKVDDNDSSTVKENKDLLIEIPGKTKVVKLPKGKRKLPKKRTKTCNEHHNINVIYKVCDENCTNKQFCTQSKECRRKQRTKKDIDTCFACTQCDYKCNQKHHFQQHTLTHNRVKNFRCNLCNYKCVQQGHLDQHMRTHTKTKPYSCNFCDYNCVQQSQLDQHMRRHTGVKPFSCNICEYTCTQRCHLDQHMRRHTGIRPFSCIHCDYTCVQQSQLNRHTMKMHTNGNIYECSHCGYRCLQLDMLVQHMNIH